MKINKSLVKGSLVLLIAFNIFNAMNFIFHFSMARMLSIENYGILATLFSIIYIFNIFSESIQTVITKYVSSEREDGKIKNIVKKSFKKSVFVAVVILVTYLFASIFLSSLLKISYSLVAITGFILFFAFMLPITRGAQQGNKKFTSLGVNLLVESFTKLLLAILLVFIGWKVYGAIIATIFGMVLALLFSFASLKNVMGSKEEKANTLGIYEYTKPAFLITLSIIIFYSLDVILAKIFFDAQAAGSYALASTLAKTIFFGTAPISKAMFPLSADKKQTNKNSENIFINALAILVFLVIVALALFYFLPGPILNIFSGKEIEQSIRILFYVGVGMGLVSIANLILLYKLSVGKVSGYNYLFVFVICEIFLLSYFSTNLLQFAMAFITSSAMFLWGAIALVKNEDRNSDSGI